MCPKSYRESQTTPLRPYRNLPQAEGWPSLAPDLGECVYVGLDPYFQKMVKDPDPWSLLFAGFLCLRFHNILAFATGITILGVCHYTLTVKGSHLATHSALTESKRWSKILLIFFLEVSLAGWGSCWAILCVHSHEQGDAAVGG